MDTVTWFEILLAVAGVATVLTGFVSKRLTDHRRRLEVRRIQAFTERQRRLAATAPTIRAWRPSTRPAFATLPVGPGAAGQAAARRLLADADSRAA